MNDDETSTLSRRKLLQSAALITAGHVTLPAFISAQTQAQPNSNSASHLWTIANDSISRTISFAAGKGITTVAFSDPAARIDFISPGNVLAYMAQEFAFDCNGHTYRGSDPRFELLNANETALPGGKSLTLRLRHKDVSLEISIVYTVYTSHPAIRKHLIFHNTGSANLKLTHLKIEDLGLALGPANELILNTQYGAVPREIFYTGRSEDAGLFLSNSRTSAGMAVVSEVPGYMKRTEIAGWDDPEHVRIGVLYDTDLMPFERSIAPASAFKTASVSLLSFRRGDGFHDPQWVLPSYTSKILMRRVNEQGPPREPSWIFNTWEPFERTINHALALELIEATAAIGMDIFTIDDGWQQEYGENAVNLTAFPGGLQPIIEAVEAKGMRLGLWIPMAAIGTGTADYRNHPEWAARDQEGNIKITSTAGGSKAVMCLASAFRDAAANRIIDAISRFHLAYVKLDLTTIFNAYGEAPGCWSKDHHHHSWAESLNMIYEGIAYATSKIYARHPDVLLDLTFELWGQKHVIDAGLLAAGDLDWLSNVDDSHPDSAGPIQARQLLYQRALSMPAESMLIGNIHADTPSIQERFATLIGSAPVLLGDPRKLSAEEKAWYHEKITWFKAFRRKTIISESFFPLGSWLQTSSDKWDGFARLARSGEGVIALFRNKAEDQSANVQLPLIPPGKFNVRSIITGKTLGPFTQPDWSRGVPIPFPSTGSVEVLEITTAT